MSNAAPDKAVVLDPARREDLLRNLEGFRSFLSTLGWHPTSRWWRQTLRAFVRSGKRQLVVRCGRRGGKSSELVRFAIVWARWIASLGLVPPGDTGFVVFVSVTRDEAAKRLATIVQALSAAKIPHHVDGDEVLLDGTNVGFKVLTASVAGAQGWTSILIIADELAFWTNAATGANPADEVLGHLRPTGATTNAPIILSSSANIIGDPHDRRFVEGDTDFQMVAFAETWVANPTLSEAELRKDEPDDRRFRRAYAGLPQPGVLDGYLADCTQQCVDVGRKAGTPRTGLSIVISIDPAWRHDEFAAAALSAHVDDHGMPVVVVEEVSGWQPGPGAPLNVEQTCEKVSEFCSKWGVRTVYSDQKDEDSLRAIFARLGIELRGRPWTGSNKSARFRYVRSLMLDKRLHLVDDAATIAQFESIAIKMTPSGTETYEGRSADDRVCAIVLGAVEAAGIAAMEHSTAGIELPAPITKVDVHAGFVGELYEETYRPHGQ